LDFIIAKAKRGRVRSVVYSTFLSKRVKKYMPKNGLKSNHIIALFAIFVVAILAVVGLFLVYGNHTTSSPTPTGVPSSGLVNVTLAASYLSSGGAITTVATTSNTYLNGNPVPTTKAVTPNSITVPVGAQIQVSYGDNLNYYLYETPSINVGSSAVFAGAEYNNELPIASFGSMTTFNGTAYTSNHAFYPGIGTGAGTSKTVQITFYPSGTGVYGNPNSEVYLAYNSSEYSSVTLGACPGLQPTTAVTTPAISANVLSGYTPTAYQITTNPGYISTNGISCTLSFTTLALSSNTAVGAPIQMFVKDGTAFINNGQLTQNNYVNPVSKVSIGGVVFNPGSMSYPLTSGAANTVVQGVIVMSHA
jgi:hypothetical protein